jgi:hypothetical protein
MTEGEYMKRYQQIQAERKSFLSWLKEGHYEQTWTFSQQHAAWQAWRHCTLNTETKAEK